MANSLFRVWARRCYGLVVQRMISESAEDVLGGSAVVFSPHFDDETLGCGGTIIKKKRVEADVNIVFMTDGSKSHRCLISEDELRAIRANEGLAASRSLGVSASRVVLLGFEETRLSEHLDSATDAAAAILLQQQPEEIFIPYYKEPPRWSEDHLITNRIVLSALQRYRRKAIVYEYPVWFWYNWPWASVRIRRSREAWAALKNGFAAGFSLMRDFRCRVYIGDVLELKREALYQHKSQMTRLVPDPRWRTLGDVSNGEFLECFFQEHEIFRRYTIL